MTYSVSFNIKGQYREWKNLQEFGTLQEAHDYARGCVEHNKSWEMRILVIQDMLFLNIY